MPESVLPFVETIEALLSAVVPCAEWGSGRRWPSRLFDSQLLASTARVCLLWVRQCLLTIIEDLHVFGLVSLSCCYCISTSLSEMPSSVVRTANWTVVV